MDYRVNYEREIRWNGRVNRRPCAGEAYFVRAPENEPIHLSTAM